MPQPPPTPAAPRPWAVRAPRSRWPTGPRCPRPHPPTTTRTSSARPAPCCTNVAAPAAPGAWCRHAPHAPTLLPQREGATPGPPLPLRPLLPTPGTPRSWSPVTVILERGLPSLVPGLLGPSFHSSVEQPSPPICRPPWLPAAPPGPSQLGLFYPNHPSSRLDQGLRATGAEGLTSFLGRVCGALGLRPGGQV